MVVTYLTWAPVPCALRMCRDKLGGSSLLKLLSVSGDGLHTVTDP